MQFKLYFMISVLCTICAMYEHDQSWYKCWLLECQSHKYLIKNCIIIHLQKVYQQVCVSIPYHNWLFAQLISSKCHNPCLWQGNSILRANEYCIWWSFLPSKSHQEGELTMHDFGKCCWIIRWHCAASLQSRPSACFPC